MPECRELAAAGARFGNPARGEFALMIALAGFSWRCLRVPQQNQAMCVRRRHGAATSMRSPCRRTANTRSGS
jgi:hypothetical protein